MGQWCMQGVPGLPQDLASGQAGRRGAVMVLTGIARAVSVDLTCKF